MATKIAESFNPLSRAHKRYRQTDGQTNGRICDSQDPNVTWSVASKLAPNQYNFTFTYLLICLLAEEASNREWLTYHLLPWWTDSSRASCAELSQVLKLSLPATGGRLRAICIAFTCYSDKSAHWSSTAVAGLSLAGRCAYISHISYISISICHNVRHDFPRA